MKKWGALGLACACVALAGCSGSSDEEEKPIVVDKTGFCVEEDDSPPWAMPMEQNTLEGSLKVSIVESTPLLPSLSENNVWQVEVRGSDGSLVDDLDIVVKCKMPGHDNHGCGAEDRITVENLGGGRYQIKPLIFIMPNHWDVSLELSHEVGDETLKEIAVFALCL